jgi:hypothetical protein
LLYAKTVFKYRVATYNIITNIFQGFY